MKWDEMGCNGMHGMQWDAMGCNGMKLNDLTAEGRART